MRVDVMSKMRGVSPFEKLWERRTTLEDESGARIELMALSDVVAAKKTQRDKDWPMIRRLVEAHYSQYRESATEERTLFWLREARTPEILIQVAANARQLAELLAGGRPLLKHAQSGDRIGVEVGLAEEERYEREADRQYWQPLKEELEILRRNQDASRSSTTAD
ncbi:MAG: hypothetical protein WD971_10540 [Pirellulales bacterium]